MNSEARRHALARACGKYLLAARMASVKEIKEAVLADTRRYRKLTPNLQAKEVIIGEGVRQRRYIICYNPKEAERECQHREQVVKDLKELLSQHKYQDSILNLLCHLNYIAHFAPGCEACPLIRYRNVVRRHD